MKTLFQQSSSLKKRCRAGFEADQHFLFLMGTECLECGVGENLLRMRTKVSLLDFTFGLASENKSGPIIILFSIL